MVAESKKNKRAVVLLSGGIDSSTTLALAKSEGYECYVISFDYAQRHKRELESAKSVAQALHAEKHLIISFDLREIGGSALTSDSAVPKQNQAGRGQGSEIPPTYVPARNTIFLSFALSWAEVLEAPNIFIGANVMDYSGYPDCRPEYLEAYEEMANLATKVSVEGKIGFRIHAPLLHLTKSEIIKKGTELGIDYSLTWSCYDPQQTHLASPPSSREAKEGIKGAEVIPCGRCDSCMIRAKGFESAGVPDPLISRI